MKFYYYAKIRTASIQKEEYFPPEDQLKALK